MFYRKISPTPSILSLQNQAPPPSAKAVPQPSKTLPQHCPIYISDIGSTPCCCRSHISPSSSSKSLISLFPLSLVRTSKAERLWAPPHISQHCCLPTVDVGLRLMLGVVVMLRSTWAWIVMRFDGSVGGCGWIWTELVVFFLWCAALGRILIIDNLKMEGHNCLEWCYTCKKNGENMNHFFLHCDVVGRCGKCCFVFLVSLG